MSEELNFSMEGIRKRFIKYGIDVTDLKRDKYNHRFFSEDQESEEQFYMAGYLLGPSVIDIKSNSIKITRSNKDILEDIKKLNIILVEKEIKEYNMRGEDTYRLSIYSKQIVEDLVNRFNLTTKKAASYIFPDWLKEHKYLRHFLRGRFDSRGSLLKSGIEINGPINFLQDLNEIFFRRCGVGKKEIRKKLNKNSNRLVYSSKTECENIFNYLYSNCAISFGPKLKSGNILYRKENPIIELSESIHINREDLINDYKKFGNFTEICKKYNVDYRYLRHLFAENSIPVNIYHYICDDNCFSNINEQSMYWAGFLAADGCVRHSENGSYAIYLGLATKDRSHVEKFKEFVKTDAEITDRKRTRSPNSIVKKETFTSELKFSSKKMFEDLSNFNIIPNKTYTYDMPDWLIEHPLVNHFMRGYIDGDGCFYIMKRQTTNICMSMRATRNFLEQFDEILYKNGIIKQVQCFNKDKQSEGNPLFSKISHNGNIVVSALVDFLYKDATVYLERKWDIAKQAKEYAKYNLENKKVKTSEISKEQLFEAAKESRTQIELSKRFGCTPANISFLLNRYDIKKEIQDILRYNKRDERQPLTLEDIFSAAQTSKTKRDMSKKLNCSQANVGYWLDHNNIRPEIQIILSSNKLTPSSSA